MAARDKKPRRVKKYQWVDGSRYRAADAEPVGRMIDSLAEAGPVSPERFVDAARPVTSPTHHMFEWDDAVAAQLHREEAARHIIRSCRVSYVERTDGSREDYVIGYISVSDKDNRGYLPSDRVMRSEDLRAQALQEALDLLRGIRNRLAHLRELNAVVREIDRVIGEQS